MSIENLRKTLLEQLNQVTQQNLSPAAANACANLAGKILATVKMEMDYSKLAGNVPQLDFFGGENIEVTRVVKDVSNFQLEAPKVTKKAPKVAEPEEDEEEDIMPARFKKRKRVLQKNVHEDDDE